MKTTVESFDDIIFENRNQEYGAYVLRRKYSKRGFIAMLIAFVIVSFAVGVPLIAEIMHQTSYRGYVPPEGIIDFEPFPERDPIIELPPPPPAPIDIKAIKFTAPKIVDNISEPGLELEPLDVIGKYANSGEVDTITRIVMSNPHGDIVGNNDNKPLEIFQISEKPIFPGGDSELLRFMAENTIYPVLALEKGIQGTVYIRFVVTKTGEISNASIMRPVDEYLDEEALRVINTLPKWTPGKNNGNPVNVWFIIPVKFKLQ